MCAFMKLKLSTFQRSRANGESSESYSSEENFKVYFKYAFGTATFVSAIPTLPDQKVCRALRYLKMMKIIKLNSLLGHIFLLLKYIRPSFYKILKIISKEYSFKSRANFVKAWKIFPD